MVSDRRNTRSLDCVRLCLTSLEMTKEAGPNGRAMELLEVTTLVGVPEESADQDDEFYGEEGDEEAFSATGPAQVAEHVDFKVVYEGDGGRVGRRD